MKYLKSILVAIVFSFIAISCSDNEPIVKPEPVKLEVKIAKNIDGTKAFAKFSFKEGKVVTDDNWDLAFYSTYVLVNGGKKVGLVNGAEEPTRTGKASLVIKKGDFSKLLVAPADGEFKQDVADSFALPWGTGKGWYNYTGAPKHAINPIPGKVIFIKTIDGNYAKMEIQSYYKDKKPSITAGRYITFKYIYNPENGNKSLK